MGDKLSNFILSSFNIYPGVKKFGLKNLKKKLGRSVPVQYWNPCLVSDQNILNLLKSLVQFYPLFQTGSEDFLQNTTSSVIFFRINQYAKRYNFEIIFPDSATPSQTDGTKLESPRRPGRSNMGSHPAAHTHIGYMLPLHFTIGKIWYFLLF